MHQTSYRSSLGGVVSRPRIGVRGINSRVQDTAYILSHIAQPASASATPARRFRESKRRGHPGAFSGINSRVQDTAYILSHVARPAPAAAYVPNSGVRGLGAAPSWLIQGLVLAMGAEWVNRAIHDDPTVAELEREVKIQESVKRLNELNYGANKGIVGRDRFISILDSPQYGSRAGLGQDLSEYYTQGSTTQGGFRMPFPSGGTASQAALGTGLTVASSAIASGSSIASSATWLAAAGGPIGLAVAGVTVGLTALFSRKKPGQKRATTEIVDSVEPLLQKNLDGYLSGPRTVSSQAQALANFDAGWDYVVKSCGIREMGDPGKWCIDDRKPGGEFDWFAHYYAPIANDANVVADPGLVADTDPVTGQTVYRTPTPAEMGGGNLTPLLIAAGLALVAYSM